MTTAEVERLLAAAFGEGMTRTERETLDSRMQVLLERGPARVRRSRIRLTRGVLLVAALLILVPAIYAVAAGVFSSEAPYGMGNADLFDAEVAAAKAVTPIPPGTTWPSYLDRAEDRGGSYATGLGRSMVEFTAYCLWLGDWYTAQDSGDATRAMHALAQLDHAREWRSFTDLSASQSFRYGIDRVISAAQAGDATAVLGELQLNCEGVW